jgi:hypothetical protein
MNGDARKQSQEGIMPHLWKIDYSNTGAGLPWEVRFDYLRGNGWSTSEIIDLELREWREARARAEARKAEAQEAESETKMVQCPECEGEGSIDEGSVECPDLWQCLLCSGEGEIEKEVLQEYQRNPGKYMQELEEIAKEQYYQRLKTQTREETQSGLSECPICDQALDDEEGAHDFL